MKDQAYAASKKLSTSVPSREAWGSLDDLDVKYAFNFYGGKSIKDLASDLIYNPIERVDELRFSPWAVFSYYIFWFVEFLTSDESKGEPDCASCFLHLVLEKAQAEPRMFKKLYPHLKLAIDIVAGRQEFYEAPVHIYGLFSDYKQGIEAEVAKKKRG